MSGIVWQDDSRDEYNAPEMNGYRSPTWSLYIYKM